MFDNFTAAMNSEVVKDCKKSLLENHEIIEIPENTQHIDFILYRLYHFGHLKRSQKMKWYGEYDGYADGYPVYDIWSCPNCGKVFEEWDEEPTWKFCPNCGQEMEFEENV